MPRFSLSSFLDNGDDDSDDEHENVEPPHPIGFSPGSSRYAFDDNFYDSEDDNDDYGGGYSSSVQEQIVPSSHVNTMTSPMKALVRHVLENNSQQRRIAARRDHGCSDNEQENENDIHALTRALRDGTLFGSSTLALSQSSPSSRSLMAIAASSQLPASYACLAQQEARIGQGMISARHRFERDHQESAKAMQALLDLNQQRADQKEARLKRQQEELEQQQAAEQQAQEKLVEAQRQEEQRKRDAREKQQEEQRKAVEAKDESRRAAEAKIKAATEYISRADKLMAQLKQLRASVEPFETSKPMAKRRLAMKKIVNGRVNTLSEDVHKIRDVARDVSNAIDTSRQEDAHYKAQMDAGGAEFTAEMARGKRYFLDLLSSKVVVRVQAEGFNG
jgi:DNA repair exonuclease SbcCD ATPase subunit